MAAIAKLWCMKAKSRDSAHSWIALLSVTLTAVCSVGFINVFGICYNALLVKFGESKEKTAWIGSIPLSLMFILGPVSSWIVNKLGLRLSAMLASIPVSASFLLTSFMVDLDYIFLTFSLLFGVGSSILLMASVKVICLYFDKWLSLALGASTGGVAFVLVGLSYLLIGLIDRFGLDRTFQILSGTFFVICVLAAQMLFPTDFPVEGQETTEAERRSHKIYLTLLKNKRLCVFLFANFIFSFSYSVSYIHQVRLAVEKGVSKTIAEQFPVFTSIAIGLGRISSGIILDLKVQNKISFFQCSMLLAGLSCFVGLFSTNQAHLIAFIWTYGFLDGTVQASATPALREILGLGFLSEAYALLLTADAVALLLGPPFVGFIVDKTNDYNAFFYVTGTPYLLGFFSLFILRYFMKNTDASNEQIEMGIPNKVMQQDELFSSSEVPRASPDDLNQAEAASSQV